MVQPIPSGLKHSVLLMLSCADMLAMVIIMMGSHGNYDGDSVVGHKLGYLSIYIYLSTRSCSTKC